MKKCSIALLIILSLMICILYVPVSAEASESASETQVLATNNTQVESNGTEVQQAENSGIPTLHIVLFAGGMVVAVGTLVAMKVISKRRASGDDYDDEW